MEKEERNRTTGRSITIRVGGAWHGSLERLLRRMHLNPVRGRAELLRNLATRESQMFEYSPYFAERTSYLVFVCANGTMIHWMAQHLYLLLSRERIPTGIGIKPEKRSGYLQTHGEDPAEDPLHKWLFNYFAVWKGDSVGDELIVQDVDRHGVSEKFCDLEINQDADTTICREILVCNRDYVLHQGESASRSDARADFFVDIPSLELDIKIVVDLDLYKDSRKTFGDARLNFEFRNRDLAKLSEKKLGHRFDAISWDEGRFPANEPVGKGYDRTRESVVEEVIKLEERLAELVSDAQTAASDGLPIIESGEDREQLRSVKLPERYLFGRFRWFRPYQGIVACITWNKPE